MATKNSDPGFEAWDTRPGIALVAYILLFPILFPLRHNRRARVIVVNVIVWGAIVGGIAWIAVAQSAGNSKSWDAVYYPCLSLTGTYAVGNSGDWSDGSKAACAAEADAAAAAG